MAAADSVFAGFMLIFALVMIGAMETAATVMLDDDE